MKFKPITQEHTMGCGIACVASLLGISYERALNLFRKEYVSTRGYYLKDIILALNKKGLKYTYSKFNENNKKYSGVLGSIVFVKRSKRYPAGHYLLKTSKGWMNPWINYPDINPAKSGFNKEIPGEIQWILYKK